MAGSNGKRLRGLLFLMKEEFSDKLDDFISGFFDVVVVSHSSFGVKMG